MTGAAFGPALLTRTSLRLRCYTSTAKYEDYVTSPVAEDVQLHKVQYWDNSPYLLFSIPWEGAADGPWTSADGDGNGAHPWTLGACGLSRSLHGKLWSTNPPERFLRQTGDRFAVQEAGRRSSVAERCARHGAGPRPVGCHDHAVGHVVAQHPSQDHGIPNRRPPSRTDQTAGPAKIEGIGQRTQKIDWWISRHGNGTGIAALSDTEIAVVNGNPPGGITIVNPLAPSSSVRLTQSVFPDAPPKWGLRPVIDIGDALLVAHTHADVATIYRVSKVTGAVSTFASNVVAFEMAQIRE